MAPAGLLLVNLGSPDSTSVPDVRRYLDEFLMDDRVIDIPVVFRAALIKGIVLRTRPRKTAAAYQSIWMEEGSPLKVFHDRLGRKVQDLLGPDWVVAAAMRYGNPSMPDSLARLRDAGVDRLVVVPMYPHYALATVRSTLDHLQRSLQQLGWRVPVTTVDPFWDRQDVVDCYVATARETFAGFDPDFVLFSYHGLPVYQVRNTDPTGLLCHRQPDCCEVITEANHNCYRAQAIHMTRAMAAGLGLAPDQWQVSFQSRLGPIPWERPYTDKVVPELARQGRRRVAVLCPAFVADCLETVEEVGIRARESFLAAGGEDLRLVPSLNDRDDWARVVVRLAREAVTPAGSPREESPAPAG